MSRTTVKAIWPGDHTDDFEELSNSWGSAPVVWEIMSQRYLGQTFKWGFGIEETFWDLWKRKDIPLEHRAVFVFTFDRAYVVAANYEAMADCIDQFLKDFPIPSERVNHWPRIAQILREFPHIPAFGLHCTSVSEDPFEGPWNEEKEQYDPPDWSTCFEVFTELAKL